jgi:hypothetical protein
MHQSEEGQQQEESHDSQCVAVCHASCLDAAAPQSALVTLLPARLTQQYQLDPSSPAHLAATAVVQCAECKGALHSVLLLLLLLRLNSLATTPVMLLLLQVLICITVVAVHHAQPGVAASQCAQQSGPGATLWPAR